jgi:hypothetical protein
MFLKMFPHGTVAGAGKKIQSDKEVLRAVATCVSRCRSMAYVFILCLDHCL